MKPLLLTLSLLLLTLLPATAAKRPDANPINIAAQLAERTDSTKIASTLEYYGYAPQGTADGYQIYRTPNGNEIRFTFSEAPPTNKYPTVVVKTQGTAKAIDSRLKEINFEKKGSGYERMKNPYSKFKTKCSSGPHSTLIFRRLQN